MGIRGTQDSGSVWIGQARKCSLGRSSGVEITWNEGRLDGSVVECLPLAQVMIPGVLGSRLCIGLPAWSLLLPLPKSLPLSVSLMNK